MNRLFLCAPIVTITLAQGGGGVVDHVRSGQLIWAAIYAVVAILGVAMALGLYRLGKSADEGER